MQEREHLDDAVPAADFTRTDLGDLLRRIDAHAKARPHALAA